MQCLCDPDVHYTVYCRDGIQLHGLVEQLSEHMWQVRDGSKQAWVNCDQIIALSPKDQPLTVAAAATVTKRSSKKATTTSKKGKDWDDDQLRALISGFLDGELDAVLAKQFSARRGMIASMRQAFECQRGNLVDEQLDDVAKTWVSRIREALTHR